MSSEDIVHASGNSTESLGELLRKMAVRFVAGERVGIKVHWGERGNENFLHPRYTREIVSWIIEQGAKPFVFDTTVLYSGGRRSGEESLKTAAENGFTEAYLGCPVRIGDGFDGRDVIEIEGAGRHFPKIQAGAIIGQADGFVIFSHFKGHMEASFGGAIKNISMGMASRAQKQRMHADVHPVLSRKRCNKCGVCVEVCPVGSAVQQSDGEPVYNLETCIGCAQCIALCPQAALKIFWETDIKVFQEKLVETAAAVWRVIGHKTVVVNALLSIVTECDCLPGKHPVIAEDAGFIAGRHPVSVDEASIQMVGAEPFDRAHPGVPWKRQFDYAREIGFI